MAVSENLGLLGGGPDLLELIQDAIVRLDDNRRIVGGNHAVRELLKVELDFSDPVPFDEVVQWNTNSSLAYLRSTGAALRVRSLPGAGDILVVSPDGCQDQEILRQARALRASTDSIWELTLPDLAPAYYSPYMRELFGLDADEMPPLVDLLPEGFCDTFMGAIQDHLATGHPICLTFQLETPARTVQYLQIRAKADRDHAGNPRFLTGSLCDVTSFATSERELVLTRERLELAVRGTLDGIWDWNFREDSAYESPRMREMLGISGRPDLNLSSLMSAGEQLAMNRAVQAHMRHGVPYNHEFWCTLPSGEIRWFRVRGQAVADPNGELDRLVGSISDVTEQRRAMAQLEDLTSSLARRVEEGTSELRHANNQLERAMRAKDAFLANMSHELRSPLNAVLGLTEAIHEGVYGATTPEQRRALATIESSGKHLLELISDILDLAKVHAGKLNLIKEPIPVADLIMASVSTVRRTAEQKSLRLSALEVPPDLVIVSDARRLKQVLINLLSNAVKFTPDGGAVSVEVQTDSETGHVMLRVADTGIGIAPDRLREVFEPFSQIDSELSRRYEGTGLGLALVSELVDALGGRLQVESELGNGSRFTVVLPWESTASVPTAKPETPAIIIEPDANDALSMRLILQEAGIAANVVGEVSRARPLLATLNPKLVCLRADTITDELKQFVADVREYLPGSGVIITSVLGSSVLEQFPHANGAVAHPVARLELLHAVNSYFRPVHWAINSDLLRGSVILLAEDNEANVLATSDFLRSRGAQVMVVRNGREAVETWHRLRPDVVLMDIHMPILDGLAAIRRIRRQETQDRTPIIAVTALAMPGDRERCLEAGADDYLTKPVQLRNLLMVIQRHLGRES